MLNEIIVTLTSGDIQRIGAFLVSLAFFSLLFIGVMLSIKKIAKNVRYSKEKGFSIDLSSHVQEDYTKPDTIQIPEEKFDSPPQIVSGTAPMGAGLNINIQSEMNDLNTSDNKKLLNLQSNLSQIQWDDLKVTNLNKKIEKKNIDIRTLIEKTKKLRQNVLNLNKMIVNYQLNNHVYLQMFKMHDSKYRSIFNKLIKTIICKKKPEEVNESDFVQFYKVNMNEIITEVLNSVLENYNYKYWTSTVELKKDLWKCHGRDIETEFENMMRNFKDINKSTTGMLNSYRTELDKRIVASSNALCKRVYEKTFNTPATGEKRSFNLAWLKGIFDFQKYKNEIWDSHTLFRIINKASIETVAIYEKIKSESIDEEMEIAAQVYQLIYLCIEERIKYYLVKEKQEEMKAKEEEKAKVKEEKIKSISENDDLDETDKLIEKEIEELEELVNPSEETLDKI